MRLQAKISIKSCEVVWFFLVIAIQIQDLKSVSTVPLPPVVKMCEESWTERNMQKAWKSVIASGAQKM